MPKKKTTKDEGLIYAQIPDADNMRKEILSIALDTTKLIKRYQDILKVKKEKYKLKKYKKV